MRARLADACALALALLSIVSSTWMAVAVYERLPHLEDEFANLWQAEVMAQGKAYLESPPEPDAFMIPFVVDYEGRRFGKYPPGWPAALSLGAHLDVPWLVNPILAGLSVWLVYRLACKIAGRAAGLLAALLTTASPMFLFLSGTLLGHELSLFLGLALALAWLDLFPPRRGPGAERARVPAWVLILVAGLGLGLLALDRPLTAIGVGLPFAIHGLTVLIRGDRSARWRALSVAVVALASASLLLGWNAALTGNALLNPYTLWWPYDTIGFGPQLGTAQGGHTLEQAIFNATFSLQRGSHDLLGWPLLAWVLLPFGLWALRRNRSGLLVLAMFPSLMLCYSTYWTVMLLYGPRYYYEGFPGLAIAGGAGLAWLGGLLPQTSRWVPWRQPVWRAGPAWLVPAAAAWNRLALLRRTVVLTLLALTLVVNFGWYIPSRIPAMRNLYGVTRSALDPIEDAGLKDAILVVHPIGGWTDYATLATLAPPFRDSSLVVVYWKGETSIEILVQAFPGRTVYHYYPDEPGTFYSTPRETGP